MMGASLLAAAAVGLAVMPWLHADGTRLADDSGQTVVLRGINLGGWLVEEIWMMPIVKNPPAGSSLAPIHDHVSLWNVARKRFDATGEKRLRTALRNEWLTDADFDRIHDAGFNCVRLPFLYDVLEEPDGFEWLDRGVAQAARRGIYVILDMHGAPGRQSADHHTGQEHVNRLFQDSTCVDQAAAWWKKIALRYRNRPEVAGYDLLNEPMGAKDSKMAFETQAKLYDAIRQVDQRHVVFFEDGYKGPDGMPVPAERGWSNVALSMHHYRFDAHSEADQERGIGQLASEVERAQRRLNVPFFLGEFNMEPWGSPKTLSDMFAALRKHEWSWAIWTYKVVMTGGDKSLWGLYRNPAPVQPLDFFVDNAATLLRKMAQVRTDHLAVNEGALAAHRTAAAP